MFRVADRTQEKLGARIVRPTYAVEIRGFPTKHPVQHGKNANNDSIKRAIESSSRTMYPENNLRIEQVFWMHGPKTLQYRRGRQTLRASTSLIVKVGSHDLQREVVRKGLVMEGMYYEAVAFDESAVVERCYKCQRWGHTQGTCSMKKDVCRYYTGEHPTRQCTKISDSTARKCANCGQKNHAP